MENENKNNQAPSPAQRTASIRTLQDDIKKANAEKTGIEPGPISTLEAPAIPKKEEAAREPLAPMPVTPSAPPPVYVNPFVRSDILQFRDGEAPENPVKAKFEISPLHTYTDDVAKAVKAGNTSLIQIAVAEQKEKDTERQVEEAGKSQVKRNILMILGSIVFILGGIGVFYYFNFLTPKQNIVEIIKTPDIIRSESQKTITQEESREKTARELIDASKILPEAATIQTIILLDPTTQKPVSGADFLSVIADHVPEAFLRSLQPEFVFGVYSNQTAKPFLVLKIDSFENAFAEMLKWEGSMERDLGKIFISEEGQRELYAITTSTTTIPYIPAFEDSVIENQDVRIIRGRNGESLLLYAFINKETLIIATDAPTLHEITERLRTSEIVR